MIDPLSNFDWHSLHARYDAMCPRFSGGAEQLDGIEPRPKSDRELYYCLLQAAQAQRAGTGQFALPQYEALLYWKLYSNPLAMGNVPRRLRSEPQLRRDAGKSLECLIASLPRELPREAYRVTAQVQSLGAFRLAGILSDTAIPVRTTLLHFFYPNVVPIFDKMVLQAVGVCDKGANQNVAVFQQYLPFAWQLADRHAATLAWFESESPVRLVDMALWVIRN